MFAPCSKVVLSLCIVCTPPSLSGPVVSFFPRAVFCNLTLFSIRAIFLCAALPLWICLHASHSLCEPRARFLRLTCSVGWLVPKSTDAWCWRNNIRGARSERLPAFPHQTFTVFQNPQLPDGSVSAPSDAGQVAVFRLIGPRRILATSSFSVCSLGQMEGQMRFRLFRNLCLLAHDRKPLHCIELLLCLGS